MSVRAARPMDTIRVFLKEIRIEHTLFALPFAYTGAIFGARGFPTLWQFVWITLAVLGARTAAMAANRLFDRDIDAKNPRTARRALVAGTLSTQVMAGAILAGLALLLIAAYELNPLCVMLLPVAAVGVLVYPLCKRFTWLTHFVLGAVDGLAPLGAYIAVTGTVSLAAFAIFAAVTVWVAGFDVVYALMDLPIDTEQSIRSLPAKFGASSARATMIAAHLLMSGLLALAGMLGGPSWPYAAGVVAALGLVAYELQLFKSSPDVFVLNEKVFNANMTFSVVFLATTAAGFAVHA